MGSRWLKIGAWNTFENLLTRGFDAVTTLTLISFLNPEPFSILAYAQAFTAPALILFVSPAWCLYRGFAAWKEARSLNANLSALRLYAFMTGLLALALSAAMTLGFYSHMSFYFRFSSLLWAFGLWIGGYFAQVDRECLRMNLHTRTLSALTLFQKIWVLVGTLVFALKAPSRVDYLAACVWSSHIFTAILAYSSNRYFLRTSSEQRRRFKFSESFALVRKSILQVGLWTHVSGTITNWVQTMDLYFLGIFGCPAYAMGLYAAALKVANLGTALPNALSNLFTVWAGQKSGIEEHHRIRKLAALVFGTSMLQFFVIFIWIDPLLRLISRHRYSDTDLSFLKPWTLLILLGVAFGAPAQIFSNWLSLKQSPRELALKAYLPWAVLCVVLYGAAALPFWIQKGGQMQASPTGLAWMNVVVGFSLSVILILYSKRKLG